MIYLEVQVNLKQDQNFKTHAINVFNDIIGKNIMLMIIPIYEQKGT